MELMGVKTLFSRWGRKHSVADGVKNTIEVLG